LIGRLYFSDKPRFRWSSIGVCWRANPIERIGIETSMTIMIIGITTIIYDVLGEIRIVILSDVMQMVVIFAGIIICGLAALNLVGWEGALVNLEPVRRLSSM